MVNTLMSTFWECQVDRSFKSSKLLKIFSKDAERGLCVYLYINIAWLKSTRLLIFRILYLRKRGSLWDVAFELSINRNCSFLYVSCIHLFILYQSIHVSCIHYASSINLFMHHVFIYSSSINLFMYHVFIYASSIIFFYSSSINLFILY